MCKKTFKNKQTFVYCVPEIIKNNTIINGVRDATLRWKNFVDTKYFKLFILYLRITRKYSPEGRCIVTLNNL